MTTTVTSIRHRSTTVEVVSELLFFLLLCCRCRNNVETFALVPLTSTTRFHQNQNKHLRTDSSSRAFPDFSVPLAIELHNRRRTLDLPSLDASNKGFGSKSNSVAASSTSQKKGKRKNGKSGRLINALEDNKKDVNQENTRKPYEKQNSQDLIEKLQKEASQSCLGKAVTFAQERNNDGYLDPFWELMPSLIQSRFPNVPDSDLTRIAGLLRHTLCSDLPKPDQEDEQCCSDPALRPLEDIHAYMPGLGPTQAFYDPKSLDICQQFSDNYDVILEEYQALLQEMDKTGKDRFQSVTSMNYESGWKTVVLFYNGHRIEGFPYHVCPTTTRLLESLPLAGRIAGFNRQQPQTGIPRHTDGNNMWLTCQMGLLVPGEKENLSDDATTDGQNKDQRAYITVGNETRHWKTGECLLYDTTYWHETFNPHPTQERVVLHVDFFNTLALKPVEIQVLQYIYSLREQFMKAEGVAKVENQIL